MPKQVKIILVVLLLLSLISIGGVYFLHRFLTAFGPDKIEISSTQIKSSDGFINPVTIEKLKVDSIGKESRPVKYTTEHLVTCHFMHGTTQPLKSIKIIKLKDAGRYYWSEEKADIPIFHPDGYSRRNRQDSLQGIIWSTGEIKFDICPLVFENGNWYFVNVLDPQIVGIYFYVDSSGKIKQYPTYTGISPI